MDLDQTAPSLKCTCIYAADVKNRQNFQDKNVGGLIVYKVSKKAKIRN